MSSEQTTQRSEYEKISSTALGVAYCRSLTDIPFSKEIFAELSKISGAEAHAKQFEGMRALTPMFEARFKLTNRLLEEQGLQQALELASGFSPRAFSFEGTLVEVDLPGIIAIKRSIADAIGNHPNVFFEEGNVLEKKVLDIACAHFASEPVAVINEGLLRYLNFDEKATIARNALDILKAHGGAWITPDITVLRERPTDEIRDITTNVGASIGRNLKEQAFLSEEDAVTFFTALGFSVERRSFREVEDELVSLKTLPISPEEQAFCLDREAFVMKLL